MIYLDNAATTKMKEEVIKSMMPYFKKHFGNPSSVYKIARENKEAIEQSREKVAKVINADAREIFFTSCGTESDNWAIKGIAEAKKKKGKHIITTKIEHHAVLHTCEHLEEQGYEVTYLDVDQNGKISLDDLKDAIRKDTILITIMFANNEIGTIQDIKEIGEIAKEEDVIFHTDAVQAVGHVPVDVKDMNIDLLSLSGHKFNGPKGIGVLYIKKGTNIANLMHGGGQERRKRPGTENVPYIVGLGRAIELANEELKEEKERLEKLRDYFIDEVLKKIDHVILNGHKEDRLPGNVNLSFKFIEGESILLMLDMKDFAASSGSACTSGSLDPSHVLLAIGLDHGTAHGSLRVTLGHETKKEDLDKLLNELPGIVQRLRDMSPVYEDFKKEEK